VAISDLPNSPFLATPRHNSTPSNHEVANERQADRDRQGVKPKKHQQLDEVTKSTAGQSSVKRRDDGEDGTTSHALTDAVGARVSTH
jgi:hypothetical protein